MSKYLSKEKKDNLKESIFCNLVFSKALYFLLEENTGIVIELENDMKDFFPKNNKVIIASVGGQTLILPLSKDEENEYKDFDKILIRSEE